MARAKNKKSTSTDTNFEQGIGLLIIIGIIISFGFFTSLVLIPRFYNQPVKTPVPAPSTAQVDKPDPEAPPAKPTLTEFLNQFAAAQKAPFYLYVKNLNTGETASIKATKSLPSGSIYKIFLANEVYRLNEASELSMEAVVKGTAFNFAECTARMVRDSYNFCGEHVRAHLGAASLTASLNRQGYTCTNLMQNGAAHTCPKDIALLYERLYKGGYFNPTHTAEFLNYLKNQKWTFRLPEGLPREPVIAGRAGWRSKTGDVYGYTHDSAIILGENTDYIVVSMSGPWNLPFTESSKAHRHLSGTLYNFMNETNYQLLY